MSETFILATLSVEVWKLSWFLWKIKPKYTLLHFPWHLLRADGNKKKREQEPGYKSLTSYKTDKQSFLTLQSQLDLTIWCSYWGFPVLSFSLPHISCFLLVFCCWFPSSCSHMLCLASGLLTNHPRMLLTTEPQPSIFLSDVSGLGDHCKVLPHLMNCLSILSLHVLEWRVA